MIVADDDHGVRRVFQSALERADFEVLTASNGRRALDIARANRASVMLLDLHMPGLDGIETLKAMRADPGLRTMRVILVTGSVVEGDRIGALEHGADDVVIKPVSMPELVARVRAQVRGRAVLTAEREAGRRYRQRLTAFLPGLPPRVSLDELAAAIVAGLPAVLDIDAVAILAFDDGTTHAIAAGGVLANRFVPGRPVAPAHGAEIRRRARLEPWIDRVAAAGRLERLELAFVPFRLGGPEPIGCLVFAAQAAASDPATLSHRLPDLADATDLIVSALRPAIEHAETTDTALLKLRAIIEQRLFVINLQPIVHLDSGAIVAVEALTRFTDGVRPDLRFAEAARIGMGPALERATVAAAIAAAANLPKHIDLSLNVSPDVLRDDFSLARVIAGAGRGIIIELTEHERIDDYDGVRAAFARLGPAARLAVDDAGSGYASLRHILNLRPSFMKLDIEWVRGIHDDPIRRSLVTGLAYFADETGCELIAEGIETEAERQALLDLGVRFGQGYLLGRPAPSDPDGQSAQEVG